MNFPRKLNSPYSLSSHHPEPESKARTIQMGWEYKIDSLFLETKFKRRQLDLFILSPVHNKTNKP